MTGFKLRSKITDIEVIATGAKLRIRPILRRLYGPGRWRKLKGTALVEVPDGGVVEAELHWTRGHED